MAKQATQTKPATKAAPAPKETKAKAAAPKESAKETKAKAAPPAEKVAKKTAAVKEPKAEKEAPAAKAPKEKAAKKTAAAKAPKEKAAPAEKAPRVSKKAAAAADEEDGGEVAERRKAQPVTVETYQQTCTDMVTAIDVEIERLKSSGDKGVKFLKNIRRNVMALHDRAPKLAKQKRRKSENAKSGLKIPQNVSDELCKFLKIKAGTQVSRVDATRGITTYINLREDESRPDILRWKTLNPGSKRNLQDSADATVINPDAALKTLLRYDQYCKDVAAGKVTKTQKDAETGKRVTVVQDSPALHYYTIQKLIKHHFLGGAAAVEDAAEDDVEEDVEDADE